MPRSKAKTTKGDGMERRARNYLKAVVGSDYESETEELPRLTRLLRKVAREAEKREREACAKEAFDYREQMCDYIWKASKANRPHFVADCKHDAADSIYKAIRNRRSA